MRGLCGISDLGLFLGDDRKRQREGEREKEKEREGEITRKIAILIMQKERSIFLYKINFFSALDS